MVPKRYIGMIKSKFKLFTREYSILNSNNDEIISITGNLYLKIFFLTNFIRFSPWTFHIMKNNQKLGLIEKKFSFQDICSDSNSFGSEFSNEFSVDEKSLIFGSTFLVELMHFEQRKLK